MSDASPNPVAKPVSRTPASGTAGHGRHHRHAAGHHVASFHNHVGHAQRRHAASGTTSAEPEVTQALRTAMAKEGVPENWEPGLSFIMQRESTGKVGASNGVDTARGLFQLTKASYHLNPHGAASFGDPVEEAQGGIRYIAQRYQTADNAVGFWKKHGWY